MDRSDKALLAAFLLAALLGTWSRSLLLNDGAVLISVGWLGDAWHLYFNQITGRAVSVLTLFGPAWAARAILGLSASAYMILAHALYFAVPLVLWLVLRIIERDRLFSRLYLAVVLVLMYFPSELIVGIGLWLIWLALVSDSARSTRSVVMATVLLGAVMAFTHPTLALMSLLYVVFGLVLAALGRPVPPRSVLAAAALSALLLGAYFATSRWLPPTNPTITAALENGSDAYINPVLMLKTLAFFPMLAALWFLLLVPGAGTVGLRWRLLQPATLVVAALGLWCATAGAGLMIWIYARPTAAYVLTLALVLALPAPAEWLRQAERPLMLFAAICAVAAISYNIDLFLFGRFVDRNLAPGIIDAAAAPDPWPSKRPEPAVARILFKYAAGEEYVRDVVMPTYDWFRVTLAFYSFFRSDRQSVVFHPLGGGADWLPFTCIPIAESLDHAHDARDRMFLTFLAQHYCAR
jgi:MFS family permease